MADWRRSTAYRIALTHSAAFALAIAILGTLVYFAADAAFRRQQDVALAEASADLVRDYRAKGPAEVADTIAARSGRSGVVTFGYALFDARGRRVAGTFDLAMPPLGFADVSFRDPVEGADAARTLTSRLPDGSRLVVGVDSQALEQIDHVILSLFVGAFLLVVLIGVVAALWIGGYLRRRIEQVSLTAEAIMAGDIRHRVPVSKRGDEFDHLGGVLNRMLERIGRLLENLRQVSADVAHDLRSPLARLRGGMESALAAPEGPMRDAAIARAIRQSDDLLALFAGILHIVDVDAGDVRQRFAPLDLGALVEDLCDSYAPAVGDRGRTLSCTSAPGLIVSGSAELLSQAVINLLDNALAHTPAGTHIDARVEAVGDGVVVVVADDGPGVPEADRERIVERFVRLDRTRAAAGHGLGLNLVAAIARAHDGTLTIGDAGPGLTATLRLPRA
ncbi:MULTISPECIES: HAMP domain-containing sensor histidine kinase [unclassified Sphingomonas]|jgi:signal transduction histidine kinase|nr:MULTISPECIES: HAMP domain-containing sensor histidine kinase [unclassified Sphingomonas]AXJ96146.1 histidine kinase [Sphingomonas sp. FARSPH]